MCTTGCKASSTSGVEANTKDRHGKQASNEYQAKTGSGYAAVAIGVALLLGAVLLVLRAPGPLTLGIAALAVPAALWFLTPAYTPNPNQAALLKLFGSYRGTHRNEGLRWSNPFYSRTKVSTRAHNFNSEKLKVNDLRGNPIEIAAASPAGAGHGPRQL